jgi:hypothetical protein
MNPVHVEAAKSIKNAATSNFLFILTFVQAESGHANSSTVEPERY